MRRTRLNGLGLLPLLFALLVVSGPLAADTARLPSGADPAINKPYLDPDFEQWRARFERPGREVYDHRERIVRTLGLEPGMHVADVGAGTGLFTLLFADAVGAQGRVYAVDVSATFVENVQRRAQAAGLDNVTGLVSTQTDPRLPPASVDMVFTSDTYHHFEQPEAMLRSIHAALRPGGAFIVIDFDRVEGKSPRWILEHVRADKETFRREIEAAGLHLVGEEDFLDQNFFFRFEKPRR